jgi:3-hydroxyacyl-[acyl-carrier-protein] dehydratase
VSFELLDCVRTLVEGHRIVALKTLSAAEPFFRGHFPGYPLMPGALICDGLFQAAALLLRRSRQGVAPERSLVLTGLDRVRFLRPVVPGDQLVLEVTLVKRRPPHWIAHGVGRVGDQVVAEAHLTLAEAAGERCG